MIFEILIARTNEKYIKYLVVTRVLQNRAGNINH
jgi:hypothetical protein